MALNLIKRFHGSSKLWFRHFNRSVRQAYYDSHHKRVKALHKLPFVYSCLGVIFPSIGVMMVSKPWGMAAIGLTLIVISWLTEKEQRSRV